MFLKLNRQNKKLRELCGTTLIGLKWLDELHEKRNTKCSEVADHAESSRDPSQRKIHRSAHSARGTTSPSWSC